MEQTKIRFSDLISPHMLGLAKDIRNRRNSEFISKGGRGSMKSSTFAIMSICMMIVFPQIHVLIVRKVGATIRGTVYQRIQWAINILGQSGKFKSNKTLLEITRIKTGQKIVFAGADDTGKLRSLTPPFGHFGILWFEEANQLGGVKELRDIRQSVIRGGWCLVFLSYNPPPAKQHWINEYAGSPPNPNTKVFHSSYEQAPPEWLGEQFLAEAEALKISNPRAYANEYGGEETGTGGEIFTNLDTSCTITDEQIKEFKTVLCGIDWGYEDPFAWNMFSYDPRYRELWVFDELTLTRLWNDKTIPIVKARMQAYISLCNAEYWKRMNYPSAVIEEMLENEAKKIRTHADRAPKDIMDFRSKGIPVDGADKWAGSREYTFQFLQGLSAIHIDPKRCPDTVKEFVEYQFERDRSDNIVLVYPDGNDHHIDDIRYGLCPVWRKKGA